MGYELRVFRFRISDFGFGISDLGLEKNLKGNRKIMRIRTDQLAEGELNLRFEKRPETFPVLAEMAASGACNFPELIEAALRARQIGDIVEVEGHISTRVRLSCGRCLQSFEMPLESQFDLTYSQIEQAPGQGSTSDEEIELTAHDMGMIQYQGDEINIEKEIQEQVVLALPLKVLCSPDCKGLCPGCGADLNTASCDCDRSPSGGKFDVLKNLKLER
jgi:uncharacterized protein